VKSVLQTKLAMVAVLLLALLGLGFWGYTERQGRKHAEAKADLYYAKVKAQDRSLRMARKAAGDREKYAAEERERHRASEDRLREALEGSAQSWGDTPVPQEVRDAL
jgi:uncharacterized protein HemX